MKQLEKGEVPVSDLKKNLEYAALVLESLYVEQTRSEPSSSVLSVSLWIQLSHQLQDSAVPICISIVCILTPPPLSVQAAGRSGGRAAQLPVELGAVGGP